MTTRSATGGSRCGALTTEPQAQAALVPASALHQAIGQLRRKVMNTMETQAIQDLACMFFINHKRTCTATGN